jgi:hypothetical protein
VSRVLFICAAFGAIPVVAKADATITPTEMLIKLTVYPKAAPKPALRYVLIPELREMQPGNPIPNYLKCFMSVDYSNDMEILGRAALQQADRAARMDKPDWQILLKAKTDGIQLLLPDVQKLRAIAAALQARFREEIAQDRLDDAIVTAKTMFAMSRHMGEHPTMIGDLVGVAIAHVAIGPLEEMLQRPGCPNLYWALTNLPNPLVSMERGVEGERLFILAELRDLDESAPMNADQIKKLLVHIDDLRKLDNKPSMQTTRQYLDERTKDATKVSAARSRLVEYGLPEERIQKFPADQIILLDEKYDYEVQRDEATKLWSLPTWQGEALAAKLGPPKEKSLFIFLLAAYQKVRRAQGRLEQRIGLLRHVEALRMYAAEHDGKWPASLSDINLPLPADPYTNKPFKYSVDGGTAHLRGTGLENIPAFNVHYELTIAK